MRSTVRLSMDYQCRPQRLWKALTDPRSLADWMGPITGRAKGGMRFHTAEGAVACSVVASEPHSRLVWRWRDPREGRTFVISWRLEPIANGCRLRFEQREATAIEESDIAAGLPAELDDASGDASFTAGVDSPRGDEAAAEDGCDDAGDLPGIAPDEVRVFGECELAVA